jgi:hypothetical protein
MPLWDGIILAHQISCNLLAPANAFQCFGQIKMYTLPIALV